MPSRNRGRHPDVAGAPRDAWDRCRLGLQLPAVGQQPGDHSSSRCDSRRPRFRHFARATGYQNHFRRDCFPCQKAATDPPGRFRGKLRTSQNEWILKCVDLARGGLGRTRCGLLDLDPVLGSEPHELFDVHRWWRGTLCDRHSHQGKPRRFFEGEPDLPRVEIPTRSGFFGPKPTNLAPNLPANISDENPSSEFARRFNEPLPETRVFRLTQTPRGNGPEPVHHQPVESLPARLFLDIQPHEEPVPPWGN